MQNLKDSVADLMLFKSRAEDSLKKLKRRIEELENQRTGKLRKEVKGALQKFADSKRSKIRETRPEERGDLYSTLVDEFADNHNITSSIQVEKIHKKLKRRVQNPPASKFYGPKEVKENEIKEKENKKKVVREKETEIIENKKIEEELENDTKAFDPANCYNLDTAILKNDVRDKDLGELLDPAKCIIDTLINLGLGLIIEKLNLKVKAYTTDLFTTLAGREFKNGPAIIAHAVENYEKIIIPICHGGHYYVSFINKQSKEKLQVLTLDSLSQKSISTPRQLSPLLKGYNLEEVHLDNVPTQGATLNCGIYLLYYCYCIITGKSMDQSNQFLHYGRRILLTWITNHEADFTCFQDAQYHQYFQLPSESSSTTILEGSTNILQSTSQEKSVFVDDETLEKLTTINDETLEKLATIDDETLANEDNVLDAVDDDVDNAVDDSNQVNTDANELFKSEDDLELEIPDPLTTPINLNKKNVIFAEGTPITPKIGDVNKDILAKFIKDQTGLKKGNLSKTNLIELACKSEAHWESWTKSNPTLFEKKNNRKRK